MRSDLITMSMRELERVSLMRRIAERRTTQREVAAQLGLSLRQIERLYASYKVAGASGLVSKRRGAVSHRRLPDELRTTALALVRARYSDFGPTLAHEKLIEQHLDRFGRQVAFYSDKASVFVSTRRTRRAATATRSSVER